MAVIYHVSAQLSAYGLAGLLFNFGGVAVPGISTSTTTLTPPAISVGKRDHRGYHYCAKNTTSIEDLNGRSVRCAVPPHWLEESPSPSGLSNTQYDTSDETHTTPSTDRLGLHPLAHVSTTFSWHTVPSTIYQIPAQHAAQPTQYTFQIIAS